MTVDKAPTGVYNRGNMIKAVTRNSRRLAKHREEPFAERLRERSAKAALELRKESTEL